MNVTGNTVDYSDKKFTSVVGAIGGNATLAFATTPTEAYKIMPLGDSNTRGFNGGGDYRKDAYATLAATYNVDFVGRVNAGNGTDKNHEGRGGFRIDHLIDYPVTPASSDPPSGGYEGAYSTALFTPYVSITAALNAGTPDAVFLMAGTNDISQGATAAVALDRLKTLISRIQQERPGTKILVSTLLPNKGSVDANNRTTAFNTLVKNTYGASQADGIYVVDGGATVNANTDFIDNLHLTAAGYDKLAAVWPPALVNSFAGTEPIAATTDNLIGTPYNDQLAGDAGDNVLIGNGGDDLLTGNGGADIFGLAANAGFDTIADFADGVDRLGLLNGLTFASLAIADVAGVAQISTGGNAIAKLTGVTAASLTADDFVNLVV